MTSGTLPVSRRRVVGALATVAALAGTGIAAPKGRSREARMWDCIVVGAGAFGSWTAWNLQRSGRRVLLLDAWGPAHARASSGGETRLIRTEYGGDPLYTRWAWESLAEWRALSGRHEGPLFHPVGALYFFAHDSDDIDRSVALQRNLGIPIEKIAAPELARRWPQVDFTGIAVGMLQPTMGVLMARRAVQRLVDDFVQAGGTYRQLAVDPPRGVQGTLEAITASGGESLRAGEYIFCCGPWLPRVFPEVVGTRIAPSRQEVYFFAPPAGDARFEGTSLPAWVDASSPDLHYGFPDIESRGFKIAIDRRGPPIDPDAADRRISDQGLEGVRAYLARRFPELATRPLAESRVCAYECSENRDLLIDRHPLWRNAWIVGGGSGHGFKHGPAVGRYVAGLVAGTGAAEPRLSLSAHAAQGAPPP